MKNDPAFPIRDSWWEGNDQKFIGYTGITIRDYFAAKAINGLCSNPDNKLGFEQSIIRAYEIADAMLIQRDKKNES